MLAFLAAVLAASTFNPATSPTTSSPPTATPPTPSVTTSSPVEMLEASVPWWERITVTVDGEGKQQSCTYQSSFSPKGAERCDKDLAASVTARGPKAQTGVYSKLTFERRFSPGPKLDSGRLEPGDKLLGQQVMHLVIDADGSIQSCKVVGSSGMRPAYDCEEAEKEQFRVQAGSPSGAPRQAFMTILAYGHQEQIA